MLSTLRNKYENFVKNNKPAFSKIFGDVVQDVGKDPEYSDISGMTNRRLSQLAEFAGTNRDHFAGFLCLWTLECLNDGKQGNDSSILAVCAEMNGAASDIIGDFIEDKNSANKFGQVPWHLKMSKGPNCFNDMVIMTKTVTFLFRRHFRPFYKNLISTVHKVNRKFAIAESLYLSCLNGRDHMVHFANREGGVINSYENIVQHKFSYEKFYLPVMLACIVSEVDQNTPGLELKYILDQIGLLHHMQNSYQFTMKSSVQPPFDETITSGFNWFVFAAFGEMKDLHCCELDISAGSSTNVLLKMQCYLDSESNDSLILKERLIEKFWMKFRNTRREIEDKIENMRNVAPNLKCMLIELLQYVTVFEKIQ